MTTHEFTPTTYFSTLGGHAPVLHIDPGDQVRTTTVDAFGRDAAGQMVAGGGNPMTGPFYINGAEPGDRLVVRLLRITPTSAEGWTADTLAYHVVDADYLFELYHPPADRPWEPAVWDIDNAAGTATLRKPETKLGKLCLPMQPMLGCFGVAAEDGQSISTATSGPHGGNMDYRGFMAGVTVSFPVFVPGALFYLGDGHALQSDGEIGGTGVETAMEVEFAVELVKNKPIRWPRGEDERFIFTVGNARPLDQALQHATTEMMRWLRADYGLDAHSAGILLGQAARYEVGNVFDPAYTMVCKLEKALLEGIKTI